MDELFHPFASFFSDLFGASSTQSRVQQPRWLDRPLRQDQIDEFFANPTADVPYRDDDFPEEVPRKWSSTSSKAPPLPPEIIILIFEADGSRQSWAVWSRVCRTWHSIAQTMLCRHLNLTNPNELRSFKQSIGLTCPNGQPGSFRDLETDWSLRWRKPVRSVEVEVSHCILLSDWAGIIPLCPALEEIRILWHSWSEEVVPPELTSNAYHLSSITALYLDVQTLSAFGFFQTSSFIIISLFPWLNTLGLVGQCSREMGTALRANNIEPPAQLKEASFHPTPSLNTLEWLLGSSHMLTTLDLGRDPVPDEIYATILSTYGRGLRSLASFNGLGRPEGRNPTNFPHLEELIFRGPPDRSNLLGKIPQTLKHLTFDYSYGRGRKIDEVSDLVRSIVEVRNLETLGIPWASEAEIGTFTQLCNALGITLRSTSDQLPGVFTRSRAYLKHASNLLYEKKPRQIAPVRVVPW